MSDNTLRLEKDSVIKLLLEFSIPAIIGMVVSSLYNVIDRIFIGHSAGSLGIAGITVGFPIMMVQFAFGGMIGMGATALISIRLGQKRKEDAELVVGNAVTLLTILGIVLAVLGLLFLDPLLRFFGSSDEVLPYAREYMEIILGGSIFQMLSFGMNNFIRAEGKPGKSMATMIVSAILNAVFAPIFIFGFHWGMRGAALATVLAQFIVAVWIVMHFATGKSLLVIRAKNLKLQFDIVAQIVTIGFAMFAMQVAQSVLTAIMNKSLLKYGGDVAISAIGIVNTLATLIVMPIVGINQGAQPLIGYNYGAMKYDRVKKTLKYAIIFGSAMSIAGFAVTQAIPSQLIAIFNSRDAELISIGSPAMRIFLLALPLVGFQIVGSGYFQAVGKPMQSTILNLLRQVIILIPLLLILPQFFQLQGVLISAPISDFLAAIITAAFLFFEIRKLGGTEKSLKLNQ
ncbi:MAG: MATE family efflux transporter [Clostridiales bacterium]|nr:MATE family efflux transporter [Clostridiales bacterium]